MNESAPDIFVFCALLCEAKPLIRKHGLKKLPQPHPYAIYVDQRMAVIISGVGKTAMAGAVGYAMALLRPKHPLLINLGIAGHKNITTGTLLMGEKIVDQAQGDKIFYPQLIGRFPCPSMPLMTLTKPDFNYVDEYLHDMEASAFYELGVKFSSNELIHCLKIVSDNQHESANAINAQVVIDWMEKQLPVIDTIINQLALLREPIVDHLHDYYWQMIERFHFTDSNRIKLKALLGKWHVVKEGSPAWIDGQGVSDAKDLLGWLARQIDDAKFHL